MQGTDLNTIGHRRPFPRARASATFSALVMSALVTGSLVTGTVAPGALPALAADPTAPLPDPNPKRQQQEPGVTLKEPEPPPLPGERPTVPWKDPKVRSARAQCAETLRNLDIEFEQLDPIKKGLCGAPAPVLVRSIGKDPAVVISPPATITCKLAVALHDWFEETVQPSAAELGTSVVKIRNASSYKCRNRYGRSDTKISEHALANALDISEFVFASGQRIKLLGNWPYGVLRDLPLKPEPPAPNPLRIAAPTVDGGERTFLAPRRDGRRSTATGQTLAVVMSVKTNPFVSPVLEARSPLPNAEGARVGTVTSDAAGTAMATAKSNPFVSPRPEPEAPADNAREAPSNPSAPDPRTLDGDEAKAFLKRLHTEACKTFETVLGPDSNAAHKDHFHLDMKKRRYVKICQ